METKRTQQSPRNRLREAIGLLEQDQLEASAKMFAQLLLEGEVRAEAYYGLGLVYFKQGLLEKAEDLLATAADLKAPRGNAQYYLGLIAERRGERESAIRYYRETVAAEPRHREARKRLLELGDDNSDATPSQKTMHNKHHDRTTAENSAELDLNESEFMNRLRRDSSEVAQRLLIVLERIKGVYRARLFGSLDELLRICLTKIMFRFGKGLLAAAILCVAVPFIAHSFGALDSVIDWGSALGLGPPKYKPGITEFQKSMTGFKMSNALTFWMLKWVLSLYLLFSMPVVAISVLLVASDLSKRMYVINDGLLQVHTGAARVHVQNIELYRITDIAEYREPLARMTGHGSLRIVYQDALAHPVIVKLTGLRERDDVLRRLSGGLREAVLLLRSIPYLKGVIE